MKTFFTTLMYACALPFGYGQQPVVGAIRWDAWCHDQTTIGLPDHVGQQVERSLGPSYFHYRVPFFGRETGPNSVTIDGRSQPVMDQEIAYAKDAGIDYWAFVYYRDGSGMDYARNLYNSSSHNGDVKACYILSNGHFKTYPSSNINWLVARFKEANYQKVLNGRPLVYIFSVSRMFTRAGVDSIRTAATAQGVPNPYIVIMDPTSSNAKAVANTVGADAISAYVTGAGNNGGSYTPIIPDADETKWNSHKATGKKVIPWVTTGWNVKPRIENPVSWINPIPPSAYVGDGTPQQIAEHLQDALTWTQQNAATVEANALIMYAWNEHDEGSWLCPTITPGTGNNPTINRSRLDAIKPILNPTATINLALNRTYTSSSSYNSSQTPDKACDGLTNTNWQAAAGNFAGEWVRVNFGSAVTFNKVVLREYGGRTQGYRIEYSTNGTTWQTAYTGTTIGPSGTNKVITFPPVIGSYARLYFTAGQNTPIIYEFEIYNTSAQLRLAADTAWDSEELGLAIFPNPGFDVVSVNYPSTGYSEATLTLSDLKGVPLKLFKIKPSPEGLNQCQISVMDLAPGSYLLTFLTPTRRQTKKLLIVR